MELKVSNFESNDATVPNGWHIRPVVAMGKVVTGKALARYASGLQRPYLRTKNVFDGRIKIDDVLSMPMTDKEFEHFGVLNGDVLLNEGQSLDLVGRCSLYNGEYGYPCAIQNQLIRFRARPGVSGTFASHLFRYCQQSGVFAKIALKTTSIAHLGGKRFERLELLWPCSENEQRAIATALSDVDALLDGLNRLIAKKRDLKQAAMQQLLTGETRLPGFEGEWEEKRLGEIVTFLSGGTPSRSNEEFWSGDIPWISASTLRCFEVSCSNSNVTKDAVESGSKMAPVNSSLLLVRGSALHNEILAGLVTRPVCFNQDVKSLVPKQDVLPRYLTLLILGRSADFLKLVSSAGNTAGVLDTKLLKAFELLLPTIPEQEVITTVLSDIDAEIEALEQRRAKTADLKQGMMQELLTGKTRLITPEVAHA